MWTLDRLTVTGVSAPKTQPDEHSFFGDLIQKFSELVDRNREILIAFDPSKKDCRLAKKDKSALRIAILMEPPVVLPTNANPENFKDFDLVFELGRLLDDVPDGHIALPWPQEIEISPDFHNTNRKKEIAMVCGNKFSFVPGELYSLRRKLIKCLDKKIDLYGTGWTEKRIATLIKVVKSAVFGLINGRFSPTATSTLMLHTPKNFRGQPKDKLLTLQNYESSLVIENWNRYYTEKLFDALKAGCLPIYVGPPLEKIGIPEGFAIQASSDYSELAEIISRSDHRLENSKRKEIEAWLTSANNPHLFSNVVTLIIKELLSFERARSS
jgi:hypothetical protein